MCPDGRFVPLGDYRSRERAALHYGEHLATMEQDHAAWLRVREAADEMRDALADVEIRHPADDALAWCRSALEDVESQVRGVVGDAVKWRSE